MERKFTGERMEPSILNRSTIEHLHRYGIAIDLSRGKRVLDIASGEGYGSNLISDVAKEVVGVDISQDAINDATNKYKKSNLRFLQGSADKIPFGNKEFDVVVSFETIEHHDKHDEMMSEISRVLKDDGIFIISSPSKLNYSDKRGYKNQFHVKELYEQEFKDLMQKYFRFNSFYHQKVFYGSVLIPEQPSVFDSEYCGDFNRVDQTNDYASLFIICISSNHHTKLPGISVFSDNNIFQRNIDLYKNSLSFKVGDVILRPFKIIRNLLR